MNTLTYIRLVGFTAGTLLQLFWMVVILGYRRQRNFERVFFFLCLSLFLFYAGSLLALNTTLYYANPPTSLLSSAWVLVCSGLFFFPSLLLHLHVEYASTRNQLKSGTHKGWLIAVAYLPLIYVGLHFYQGAIRGAEFDFVGPIATLGWPYKTWLCSAMFACALWDERFAKANPGEAEAGFIGSLGGVLLGGGGLILILTIFPPNPSGLIADAVFHTILAFMPLLPMVDLIYAAQKRNFLLLGQQKNLVYAVSITFLALLYLSVIRRAGDWLEPVFPPEATAAVLVFVLVIFFEPLQRVVGRQLRATAQTEMDRTQKILGAIQGVARAGNSEKLNRFIEEWVKERFEFAEVRLILSPERTMRKGSVGNLPSSENTFEIAEANRRLGSLEVKPHGAMISGETRAALEFLCEQLSAKLDLCRLIEEKVELEKELAERERLALVGQTAASISHNLKNPLGAIKTILQVQLENPEMPESMRGETKMVLEEIGRLSGKLNQLLQFSRPAVRAGNVAMECDARVVIDEAVSVLRPQAEKRRISLRVEMAASNTRAAVAAEALNDIASNLLVNALEAVSSGGHVTVSSEVRDGALTLFFDDDGPGIPESLREKILQPFFTTKSQGTGLGLAIVARRVGECNGTLVWNSPLRDGRGTRFEINLPRVEAAKEAQ
ncbi:MAG: hypothetical protein JSS69_13845 [Acidobacteria bacterium]|nr:hypothetical protein [Acidobacteriota bacterium]MBS1866993.1 hypothetical protein [Acidobacteriota bacterium]